jgi:serralysin
MVGGLGNDTYVVDNAGDDVVELDSTANDTVYASISFTLPTRLENLSLVTNAGAINGTGNELDNVIHGNESR